MLPTELLMFKVKAGLVEPRRLKPTPSHLTLVTALVGVFESHLNDKRFQLEEDFRALEVGRSDYRVVRGLTHLLANDQAEFETGGTLEPSLVREKVFELAQGAPASRARTRQILAEAARTLSLDSPEETLDLLYADLSDQQRLVSFDPPDPVSLLQRFDLAQAQGMLYRAYSLTITAHRNEPARYKQLLKYTKLFGLMVTVEGDADIGFTLTMDGPTSLFGGTTRYGLALAKFLPALLHVTKWDLSAALKPRKDLAWVDPTDEEWSYQLTSEDGYVSHYKEPKEHDSALESGFTERFERLDTPWTLEREVDLVPVPGGVIIPDFRLLHEDGRSVLVEIVGYWRPDYLRKKFNLLRKSGRTDVIVAVSERLNLEKAGVKTTDFGERVLFFKGVLHPKTVLELAETISRTGG
jgi:predicted nuclease of restriction endonuclease-like RecB superfamily